MSDNPYESPPEAIPVIGVNSGRWEDLRKVAVYQKGILMCVLANLAVYGLVFLAARVSPEHGPLVVMAARAAFCLTALAGLAFIFLLSTKVYNAMIGIVLGLLLVVPILNLVVLLAINGKATTILRANGHRVGFLGARLAEFD